MKQGSFFCFVTHCKSMEYLLGRFGPGEQVLLFKKTNSVDLSLPVSEVPPVIHSAPFETMLAADFLGLPKFNATSQSPFS